MTESGDVTIDGIDQLDAIKSAAFKAPAVFYFWTREAFKRISIDHRRAVLSRAKVRLNRKPTAKNPKPIRAPKVDEARDMDPQLGIRWNVYPTDKRRRNAKTADLEELGLEAITRNKILAALEKGGKIRPKRGRMLAVPIKPPGARGRGRRTPTGFRKANPKAVLIAKKSKKSGTLLLFERKRKRSGQRVRQELTKSGKPRSNQRKTYRDTLIPRWALLPEVSLRNALGYFHAWDSQAQKRSQRMKFAADRILRDLARGIK